MKASADVGAKAFSVYRESIAELMAYVAISGVAGQVVARPARCFGTTVSGGLGGLG
jgi:hypothetical protein